LSAPSPPPHLPKRRQHLDVLAVSLLLGCCVFWGFQQVLVKATVAEIPPVTQAAIRFVGATALLWLWCRWRGVSLWVAPGAGAAPATGARAHRAGLVAGGLFAVEFALLYLALRDGNASRVTLFLYTSPFWVALLLPWVVRSERLTPWQWVGLVCAFAAVGLALAQHGRGAEAAAQGWAPDLMALGAGLAWGLTTVVIRATPLGQVGAERLLLYQVGVSALTLPALAWLLGETWPAHWSGFAITSILVQTVLGAFASYLLWMWLLTRYPATLMSAFVFMTPLCAMAFGVLWLGEPWSPTLLLALGLVAVGIALVALKPGAGGANR
jgi:drug/metabolite transporter (DMT)-like permease